MNAAPKSHLFRSVLLLLCIAPLAAFATVPVLAEESAPADAVAPGDEAAPTAAAEETAEATAEENGVTIATLAGDVDVLWTCLAAFLVFFMQAGFAMVECGFTRAKNACNIIMKNLMDFAIGSLAFWLIGFGLMFGATSTWFFGNTSITTLFGTTHFFYDAGGNSFNWAFLIFQTVFCATAATIISGAMAERTKFIGYLIYTVCITVIVYPVFGSWAWGGLLDGGGWLEGMGFYDFAGSTVVHSIGGWAALAGAIVLGPRLGKYAKDGRITPIPGHNIPLAALGVFILWLGWFGFNPGSTTAVGGGDFAYIAVTTNASAAAGAIAAMIASWVLFKKPDVSFAMNGALAGLVTITAGCPVLSVPGAFLAGAIGGVLCVFSVLFFDRIRVDDPVGAVSVHGVCGAWGTLAVGLFACPAVATNSGGVTGLFYGGGLAQLGTQFWGVAMCFIWAFFVSLGIFYAIKMTVGLRVSEEEEMEGLDVSEHGMHAYPPHLISDSFAGTAIEHPVGVGAGVAANPVAATSSDAT